MGVEKVRHNLALDRRRRACAPQRVAAPFATPGCHGTLIAGIARLTRLFTDGGLISVQAQSQTGSAHAAPKNKMRGQAMAKKVSRKISRQVSKQASSKTPTKTSKKIMCSIG